MDLASFVGGISGFVLVIIAIFLGGDINSFVDIPGLMIVIGGTISATLFTFPFSDVKSAFKAAVFVFSSAKEDPNDMVSTMVDLCTLSRRKGHVALSKLELQSPFLEKACNLIADGSKEELLRDALNIEIEAMKQRHFIHQDVFSKMALYAPSLGMMGTLVGLIHMLSRLNESGTLGTAMSTALLTTFYGTMVATLILNPIAGKLHSRTLIEVTNLEIIYEGAASIIQENNPMLVYEKLSSFVPTKLRRPMQKKIKRETECAGDFSENLNLANMSKKLRPPLQQG